MPAINPPPIDKEDSALGPGVKGLLKRACAIGRRRDNLAGSMKLRYAIFAAWSWLRTCAEADMVFAHVGWPGISRMQRRLA